MDDHQGDRDKDVRGSRPAQPATGASARPPSSGRTTLLHWAIFLGLMTALIGGAAVVF